ncbi:MAG: hypothetical protein ABSE07_02290 [Methanoregula sp.]|jgi:hypothetical protein
MYVDEKNGELDEHLRRQRQINEDIEDVKRRQTEEEKTREWNEQRQSTLARRQTTADEQSALLNAKSGPERIKLRQRIEDRQRAENDRIEMANAGRRPSTEHKLINAANVKETFRNSLKKTPSALDKFVTGSFLGITEKMSTPASRKKTSAQYKMEMNQMSRVVNRRKLTGGSVKQIAIVPPTQLYANPNFNQQLLPWQQVQQADHDYQMQRYQQAQAQMELQRQHAELQQMRMAQVQGQYESPETRVIAGRGRVMVHNTGIHGQPRQQQAPLTTDRFLAMGIGNRPVLRKKVTEPLERLNAMLF